jgi:hypothetical protein
VPGHGSIDRCGTMLYAVRSRVPFPIRSLDFSIDLILAALLRQPLTEMSTRNRLADKGWPARKADDLTAICEPIM